MPSCQAVVSKEPLEYCGNEPAEEYELSVEYDGGVAEGTGYFCDECKPRQEHIKEEQPA